MKTIESHVILSGISARKDGSLRLSFETPELTPDEKVAFMELQNQNVIATLTPMDEPEAPVEKINRELTKKTQSQRLRDVLYVMYAKDNEGKTWEQFYEHYTNQMIDWVKSKLDS